jgi:hypothetical protein
MPQRKIEDKVNKTIKIFVRVLKTSSFQILVFQNEIIKTTCRSLANPTNLYFTLKRAKGQDIFAKIGK